MAEKKFIKWITRGSWACSCQISMALYSDDITTPTASKLIPQRIINTCDVHREHRGAKTLEAALRSENRVLDDAKTRIRFSGATVVGWDLVGEGSVAVTVSGASPSLRDDLSRCPNLTASFV